jgi:hypothetical protein
LPDGLSSIPPDSLNKLVNKIGIECKRDLNVAVLTKWSPEFETLFRKNLYNQLKKSLSEEIKKQLVDCFISKYKKIYAHGVPKEIPIDVENKVLGACYLELKQ